MYYMHVVYCDVDHLGNVIYTFSFGYLAINADLDRLAQFIYPVTKQHTCKLAKVAMKLATCEFSR